MTHTPPPAALNGAAPPETATAVRPFEGADGPPSPSPPPTGTAKRVRVWSLRREIVVGYSAVLLIALALFAFATYLILRQTLARTGTQSLRETAAAAEQLILPANIPRIAVVERFAVVGHSMGGVLSMTLAARASGEGLPPFKAVLLANPGRGVTGPEVLADFSLIPASTLLVGVSGSEDSLGTDAPFFFYQATAVPLENKDHVTILSDYHSTPALVADHFAPNCLTSADVNAFDVNGYWKWFDGLTAAAFYGRYREYALGNTPQQRFMGTWPDGTPIVEPIVSDSP